MSRISEIIRRVERREAIDLDQEMTLITLEFARQGERFAEGIVELIESLDEAHRYAGVEAIEFFESGQIKSVRLRDVASADKQPANHANESE